MTFKVISPAVFLLDACLLRVAVTPLHLMVTIGSWWLRLTVTSGGYTTWWWWLHLFGCYAYNKNEPLNLSLFVVSVVDVMHA
jgi:hypothetical protein